MNDGLKQRIVGAIVLVALAIVVLPMLFDFSGERHIDRTSRIPERPQIEPVAFEEPTRPDNVQFPKPAERIYQLDESRAEVEQAEEAAAAESKPAPQPKPEAPGLADNGMLAGWVVQVGAFQDADRANKLEQSLMDDGYKAYQQENRSRGLYFVYVGPDSDKRELLQAQKKIDKKYRVKSKVLKFEP